MKLFRSEINKMPRLERLFVIVLAVVLFCFAAAQVYIVIPPGIAAIGRWAGMFIALVLGYRWQARSGYRLFSTRSGIGILIGGLLCANLLSTLDSVNQEKSMVYLAVLFLQVVLFALMSRRLSLESWRFLFNALALLCVFVSFMGLKGYAFNPDKYIVQGRLAGLSNANSTGLVAMIGAIICLAKYMFAELLQVPNPERWKRLYVLGGIGCLIVLVLSGSKSSLGGLISGVLVVLFFKRRLSHLLFLVPLTPFVNMLLSGTWFSKVTSVVYNRGGDSDMLYSRRGPWAQAIEYFKESPWFGQGYAVHDASGMVVDGSGYHGLLASVGILGTIMFFSVAMWILVRLYQQGIMLARNKNHRPFNRELMACGGGCCVALLVHAVGEPWMLAPGSLMHVVFWLSAGACISGIMIPQVLLRVNK